MTKTTDKDVFYTGFSFIASALEYCLILAPMLLGAAGASGLRIMALLSVLVMSFSGLVLLFNENRISNLGGISPLFRWLVSLAVGFTVFALVAAVALLIVGCSNSGHLERIWPLSVIVLCVALGPRVLLDCAIFIYRFRRLLPPLQKKPIESVGAARECETKRNPDAFDSLWEGVFEPKVELLCEQNNVILRPGAKDTVWNAYCNFNVLSSERYTRDSDHRLDRHKVAACYACAVLKAMPLDVGEYAALHDKEAALANERLAVTVGASVLANFLSEVIDDIGSMSEGDRKIAKEQVARGVKFPQVGHGTYLSNLLDCFSSMQIEGNYNLPLMFQLMFVWEQWIFETEEYYAAVIEYYAERNGALCANEGGGEVPFS